MSHRRSEKLHPGVGMTAELSLRVSVATLVRLLFKSPIDGEVMLALERKATLFEEENSRSVGVKAQPFGGAIRLHDLEALQHRIGDFHFDTELSRSERDFRIFIQPSAWGDVQEFCLQLFSQPNDAILESDPTRELAEEFEEALKTELTADRFHYRPVGTVIENTPSPTENIHARDSLTARIYHIFEAHVLDPVLIQAMLTNSESYSNHDLEKLALADSLHGGLGWANAVLALSANQINAFYLGVPPENRNRPVLFQGHRLDETVAAILADIPVPKYQKL